MVGLCNVANAIITAINWKVDSDMICATNYQTDLKGVSSWPSCLRRWLGSRVYIRARDPSSKPSYGAHWHGPTQPTTWSKGVVNE